MTDDTQKLPPSSQLSIFTHNKVMQAVERFGKALPCSVVAVEGQIVTVAFQVTDTVFQLPNITLPVATSFYDWLPIQVGDKGFTTAADVYLGGVSGLGGGIADLTRHANLATLVFVPISNTSWTTTDPNKRVVQGPNGVVAQDIGKHSVITLDPENITISVSNGKITLTSNTQITLTAPVIALNGYVTQTGSSGGIGAQFEGPVQVTGDVVAAGISVQTHVHGGVETGDGDTGAPVA